MPTINALFSHQVSVLMGDYLYSRALREIVRSGDVEALRILTEASSDMTLGEMRQLAAVDKLGVTEDEYFALNQAKTASLIAASCEVGALHGAAAHRAALARYGEQLGMAFQGSDLRERKVTLPLIAAMREMSAAERSRVTALFAAPVADDGEIAAVIASVA